jgi:glycosyltransferase involved in cell wall biosynthesis
MATEHNRELQISFVIPVFNEEGNLKELQSRITEVMDKQPETYEVVYIDDGSSDSSLQILTDLQQDDHHIRVIQLRRNFGKAAAYSAGFDNARGEIVITLDADLQDDPDEIPLFVEKINEGVDMVVGWRYSRKAGLDKTLPSKIFNKVVSLVTQIPLHDFNCPYKAYRREVFDEVSIRGELHRYIPVLAHARGFSLTEIRIENKPRFSGKSKYGAERYIRGMLDLITVTFITRFAKRPLHFLGLAGLITCFLGGVILTFLTGAHFLHSWGLLTDPSWNIHDRPALSLGILLMIVGTQFFSMGLLGELFITAGSVGGAKDDYSIKKILG